MAAKTYSLPVPGIPFSADQQLARPGVGGNNAPPPKGIFAEYPGYTPKYVQNIGLREGDFRDTMARMFVQVSGNKEYRRFMASVAASSSPDTQKLASVLVGDKNGNNGHGYIDFLLQQAQHSIVEKYEVVELLSDNYVSYFFGRAAPMFSYSGTLVNTKQDDQTMNMLRLYLDVLRGSKLAQRNQVMRLRYDGLMVFGVMTNFQWALNGDMETANSFSFNFLVKQILILPNSSYGIVTLDSRFDPTPDLSLSPDTGASTNNSGPVRRSFVPPPYIALQLAGPTGNVNTATSNENFYTPGTADALGITAALNQQANPPDDILYNTGHGGLRQF